MLERLIKFFRSEFRVTRFEFEQWLFQWVVTDDRDRNLGLLIAQRLLLLRYKEHVLVYWNRKDIVPAPRHAKLAEI